MPTLDYQGDATSRTGWICTHKDQPPQKTHQNNFKKNLLVDLH
jgi:hypothetical protein